MGATDGLEALLSSWAHSPTAGRLQEHEDGLEPVTDLLGDSNDFNLDLLLPPSPAPPPVEDSSGSGTATLGGPVTQAGQAQYQQQHFQQQPDMLQQQHSATLPHPAGLGAAGYALPADGAGAGALPPLDLAAASAAQQQAQHQQQQFMMPHLGMYEQQQQLQGPPQMSAGAGPSGSLVLPTLSALHVESSTQHTTAGGTTAPSGSEAPTAGTGPDGKRRRGPRPRVFKKHACQADGCAIDLAPLSFYLQRNHICPDHLKADSYPVKGVDSRFCQRCGQGHPLTEFEGSKRSCRKALERHNQRRRDKQQASTATGPEPAAAAAAVEAANLQQQQQAAAADAESLSFGLLDPANSFGALQPLPVPLPVVASTPAFPPGVQQQAQQQMALLQPPPPQQQQQQRRQGMSPVLASPPQPQHAQEQLAQPQQQAQQQSQSQWVLLPRHLLEQHAPQLLAAALPAAGPALKQLQPVPQQQQHMQPSPLSQQGQPPSPPQPVWPVKPELPPNSMAAAPSFNLWQGEFGGSGI